MLPLPSNIKTSKLRFIEICRIRTAVLLLSTSSDRHHHHLFLGGEFLTDTCMIRELMNSMAVQVT